MEKIENYIDGKFQQSTTGEKLNIYNSAVDREGGFEALKLFTEQKNICIKY